MGRLSQDTAESACLVDWLHQTAAGDVTAFNHLYRATAPRVGAVVGAVLKDATHAEDVVQEVFLEIWRDAGRFDPRRGRALSWIVAIARHRAVDRIRRAQAGLQRECQYESLCLRDRSSASDDPVIDYVTSRADQRVLLRALGEITWIQRESIVLAYFTTMSYSEVASFLSTPIGTVKTRIRDGLARLQVIIRNDVGERG
ncbi:sigma-70 family RNA polymerase sigma factor [Actinokineospora globicatena]|uniref:sigma-70 family RNA polymerase sigma factor n=1 Tax=Actinokineospora globicatena TaxID=103729 RepID=UPI0020A494B3|nr:sigma-70 family RNA polymerase sigma factor [Actinokineospora globicatena]MCP2303769.1 RNA polymerase sigma-70 factor, ECF subfamily [Actinokineospora globicatena]GLW79081.1 RNA polymerase sigma factor SigK [Actinokineospora globicatena]GLW86509.1 RNA polymerase sigma factor SigK [Actinokineospora globicatena]